MSSQPHPIGTLFRAVLAALDGAVQGVYDAMGVDFRPRYFSFVRYLAECDSATVTELARRAHLSQPAATQTIAELLRMGLLERCEAADARARAVRLSSAGRNLTERLEPAWRAIERAIGELDEELAAPLGEVLQGALTALEREPFDARIRRHMT